jgi:hypothetical protein
MPLLRERQGPARYRSGVVLLSPVRRLRPHLVASRAPAETAPECPSRWSDAAQGRTAFPHSGPPRSLKPACEPRISRGRAARCLPAGRLSPLTQSWAWARLLHAAGWMSISTTAGFSYTAWLSDIVAATKGRRYASGRGAGMALADTQVTERGRGEAGPSCRGRAGCGPNAGLTRSQRRPFRRRPAPQAKAPELRRGSTRWQRDPAPDPADAVLPQSHWAPWPSADAHESHA